MRRKNGCETNVEEELVFIRGIDIFSFDCESKSIVFRVGSIRKGSVYFFE